MLKSINYWSYPGGLEGSLPLPDFFAKAKRDGFEVVEVAIGHEGVLNVNSTEADCQEILRQAEAAGVQIKSVASGCYWARAIGDVDSELRALAVDDLKKMARITGWLNCRALLTIPGAVDVFFLPDRAVQPADQVLENARNSFAEVLPVAQEANVVLAIENVWNKLFYSVTELRDFIDSFNSPHIGAYVDVANMLPYGYPEEWIRILGHRVAGIHFKDFKKSVGTADGFCDLLEGDVNWPEVVAAIRAINYQGPVAAEMIPLYRHCQEVRCANASRAMDAILAF